MKCSKVLSDKKKINKSYPGEARYENYLSIWDISCSRQGSETMPMTHLNKISFVDMLNNIIYG